VTKEVQLVQIFEPESIAIFGEREHEGPCSEEE